jgi:DNA-binding transcriptional MerR regulator
MKTIHEIARQAGVSVRTLHYYDEIGLLHPDGTTAAGYRLYGNEALGRLQQVLFFRELGFPLREIADIMQSDGYDARLALEHHRTVLSLKRDRLDRLIELTDRILKGEKDMSFTEFDTSEIEAAQKQYAAEARQRWGGTEAYAESQEKTAQYGQADWKAIKEESEQIFSGFAALRGTDPAAPEAQRLVEAWRRHITRHFYNCTKVILGSSEKPTPRTNASSGTLPAMAKGRRSSCGTKSGPIATTRKQNNGQRGDLFGPALPIFRTRRF